MMVKLGPMTGGDLRNITIEVLRQVQSVMHILVKNIEEAYTNALKTKLMTDLFYITCVNY